MNEEIKARWVAELRSGDRRQVTGALRRDGGFCCLGVLCDLAAADGVGRWVDYSDEPDRFVSAKNDGDWSPGVLPIAVQEWSGLDTSDPSVLGDDAVSMSLANRNDDLGTSFADIADLIKRGL